MWPVHLFRYQATQMSKKIIFFEILKWYRYQASQMNKKSISYFKIIRLPVHLSKKQATQISKNKHCEASSW